MKNTTIRKYGGYPVDEQGNIYNKNGRLKKLSINHKGYPMVGLCWDGVVKTYAVHRIIATVFHGHPVDEDMQVDHIDNDRTNFHPDNLRWGTPSDNVQKSYDEGVKDHSGFKAGASKYTVDDFRVVLGLLKAGYCNRYIEDITSVKNGTIKRLKNGTHFFVREGYAY